MKPIKLFTAAMVMTLMTGSAMADRITISSDANVERSVKRLVNAVEDAGARIFNKVDFHQGAKSQGESLRPTTVVIFGSPKIGSTALQEGQTLGLYLPLRILFFEDENGQTWATYDDPTGVAPTHGVAEDNPAILRMNGALEKFAALATGN